MSISNYSGIAQSQGSKVLTMEEAIMGYHLQPRNQRYQWRGEMNQLTLTEGAAIVALNEKNEKNTTIITFEEIGEIIGQQLRGLGYQWEDANTISFAFKGNYYQVDVVAKELVFSFKLPEKVANITPSNKGNFAYTVDNNLYICDQQGQSKAITSHDDPNFISGQTVSRNEFGITGGIFWSPDGSKLAFYTKDESKVGTFPLLDITTRTGTLKEIKYPMAGMDSEVVTLSVYDLESGETEVLKVDDFGEDRYLTNITFSPDSKDIYVMVLNRNQKEMKLNKYCSSTGDYVSTILEEKDDRFVEPLNPIVFLENNSEEFLYITNCRDAYRNIYLCNDSGDIQRLTNIDADVAYVAKDAKNIYYTSAEVSPIENHLFKLALKSGKVTRLTDAAGWHNVVLSKDCSQFIDIYSNLNTPRNIELRSTKKSKLLSCLFTAENPVKDYNFGEIILDSIKSADGLYNNYYRLIKPANFDPSKKYPVIVYVYGGPHSQMVQNTWLGQLRMWEMYMAQRGYVVYVQDNRGTSNQGAEFEKAIYGQCGKAEMADQMEGIAMLKTLPYVDGDKIGVHGWSYGGFMTISLMTNYPEVFKVGVAGGPVIDWKWYEIMYGERYMGDPSVNKEGYESTSLIAKAADLKGKLLICQGGIDNVVLWQHSLSFVRECVVKGVQVDYFPYPCHEHNVIGKDRIHLMNKVSMYFDDFLGN